MRNKLNTGIPKVWVVINTLTVITIIVLVFTFTRSGEKKFKTSKAIQGTVQVEGKFYRSNYSFQTISCLCSKHNQLTVVDESGVSHLFFDYDRDGTLVSHRHDSYIITDESGSHKYPNRSKFSEFYSQVLRQIIYEANPDR